MQLRLVGDGEIGLAGGHQLGRVIGVGGRDQLDLEPLGGEEALLARHDERAVVGVDEPVQDHGELVGRRCRQARERHREHEQAAAGEHHQGCPCRL